MRFHEPQFYYLAAKARQCPTKAGYLFKKSGKKASPEFPGIRWQKRWCILYYNLIFYYETEQSPKPQGVIVLEGSECHKVCSHDRKLYSFVAGMPGDEYRKFMFSTETEEDCNEWMAAVTESSVEKAMFSNKELYTKTQTLEAQVKKESEKKAKLQREVADQWAEIARLKMELASLKSQPKRVSMDSTGSLRNSGDSGVASSSPSPALVDSEFTPEELRRIVKVQSQIRGWIARTRWKKVAERFLLSPEGDKLKQRNKLLWQFTVSERDYVEQLNVLVNVFLRPFFHAAKSSNPCINEAEVESIFSNIEIVCLLHQLFLTAIEERLSFWPFVYLEGFLTTLSSMTHVYHEYIRNHPYALQTLAQCKQRPKFASMLKWHERKDMVKGQTIVQLLYSPVRTVNNYIRYLRDLIEVTSDEDSEKDLLEEILNKLEEMQMALTDVLSEGESIKHTLEIERLIDGGCNVLLDINQKFIRHGLLRQINSEIQVSGMKREKIRHCFLFSRHMIVTSRTTDGSLRLAKVCGMVPLRYTTLVEDIEDESIPIENRGLSFLLKVQTKGETFHVVLMATKSTDKAAWTSDITQCIYTMSVEEPDSSSISSAEGPRMSNVAALNESTGGSGFSSTPVNQGTNAFKTRSLKDDKRLNEDSVDIKYGEVVGPYNLPQIQHASVDRLIERLVDPRFPGTEFMDTFLLTYRIFTNAKTVLEAIVKYYLKMEEERLEAIREQKRKEEEEREAREKMEFARRERNTSVLSKSSPVSSSEDLRHGGELSCSLPAGSVFTFLNSAEKFRKEDERKGSTTWFRDDTALSMGKPRSSSLQYQHTLETSSDMSPRRRTSPAILIGQGKAQSVDYLPSIGTVEDEHGSTTETLVDIDHYKDQHSPVDSEIDSPELNVRQKPERCSSDRGGRRSPFRNVSVERSISDIGTRYNRHRPVPIFGSVNYDDDNGSPESRSALADMGNGRQMARSYDETNTHQTLSRSNTSIASTGFEDTEYPLRRMNKGKMSLELPRNPIIADLQYEPTKRLSLPDTSAQPGYQKNLVKWLGMDAPGQGEKGRSRKGKGHSDRLSISENVSDDEMRPREESISFSDRFLGRKSFLQGSKSPLSKNSKKAPKAQGSPDSPRKKRGIFGSAFKTSKSGMKRSKSDFLRTSSQSGAIREDEEGLASDRLSYTGDDDSTPGTPSECGSETAKDGDTEQLDQSDLDKGATAPKDGEHENGRKGSVLSVRGMQMSRAPLKILNVIKHWLSKFPQDFDGSVELTQELRAFFRDIKEKEETLPLVKSVVRSIERLLDVNRQTASFMNPIDDVLTRYLSGKPPRDVTKESIWTPVTVADNLTLLEHHLYSKIPSQEFLKCAWTKKDKETKAPYILKVSKRFNQVTNLIAWRVVHGSTPEERASVIQFWINVAISCRNLNNYNSVLQIAGGLTNSAVYRLKKSWELVPKHLRDTLEDLQALVSADKSFRRLREALHQCNPPCVPYLGIYLSDLLFMDEGAKNFDDDQLVNFAKMNRISRCIREIKQYQQLRYTLELEPDVLYYLVATEVDYDEDKLYEVSLTVEPRESAQRTESS